MPPVHETVGADTPIAAGFASFREAAIPPEASAEQVDDMRTAFFAGAEHLFSALIDGIDGDCVEPNAADVSLLDKIAKELLEFVRDLEDRVGKISDEDNKP